MNRIFGLMAGAAFAVAGSIGSAATINTSAYDTSMILYDEDADIVYSGFSPVFSVNFVALGVSGDVLMDSFIISDPLDAILDATGLPLIIGWSEFSIMTAMVQFLFEDGATGYLVTVDASDPLALVVDYTAGIDDFGIDFTNPLANFDALGTIKLEKLTVSVSAVPLPASLPLVLAGMGGLVLMGRRRKAA